MRAVHLTAIDELALAELPSPEPAAGEAVVRLRASALNHRDVWIKQGLYPGTVFPVVPGSDGVGEVVSAGEGADPSWEGRRVILNPSLQWGDDPAAQGADFQILGLPRDGTFAEEIAIPVSQLAAAPEHLSDEEAAALPLAGLTAWRALMTRGALRQGERVLITGVGGGVALFALQFAAAAGAEAWVTSGSSEKLERAEALGARGGALYTEAGWADGLESRAGGLFDLVIDSAGGPGFEKLVDLAAPGGRIVFFGATCGNPPELPARKVFWRQLSLLGTTMGSPSDWGAMLAFVEQHRLRPVVSEVFPLDSAAEAFALMESGGQFGKIVLRHGGTD